MNIFKKISDISTTIIEAIREDVTPESYRMSKSEFYQQHFPKNYDNTITYVVQYHSADTVTSWGPFYSIELANQWSDKLLSAYSIQCDIVYVHNSKSDPSTWFI